MQSKKTVFTENRPVVVMMIKAYTPERVHELIRLGLEQETEAFGIQMEYLKPEYRDEKTLRGIFSAMEDKPCYVTNYRNGFNEGKTDDEVAEELVYMMKCGGTLADIMGDCYAISPDQLTDDSAAIKKQKALSSRLHDMGCQVLFSSHIPRFMHEAEVLHFMNEHKARGADISKIVTSAATEAEAAENIEICLRLEEKKTLPTLFLSSGEYCKRHRYFGPILTNGLFLCIAEHDELAHVHQPLLSDVRRLISLVKDN